MYLDFLGNESGGLSTLWMSYINMVDVVLGFICAPWEGSRLFHLAMARAMLPWTFAIDKQNCGRYLSVYYTRMTGLEICHLEMHDHLKIWGFSEQIGWSNPFGRILVDQTTEEMTNTDTQKAFSLNACLVSRYYMAFEYRKVCLWNLRHIWF